MSEASEDGTRGSSASLQGLLRPLICLEWFPDGFYCFLKPRTNTRETRAGP